MVAAEPAIVKTSSVLVLTIDIPVVKFDPDEEQISEVRELDRVILVEFMSLVWLGQ